MNTIIALAGMAGSGKSEVVKFLESKGFFKVYFGGATIEEINKRKLEVNPENERKVREDLRKKYGMAAYAIINKEKIEQALEKGNVIIDGLYSWSEYKFLKKRFGTNLIVFAIVAPRMLRYQRLAERPERPLNGDEARSRDWVEIENSEKGGPIAIADYTVVNDGTLEKLNIKIDNILKKINV